MFTNGAHTQHAHLFIVRYDHFEKTSGAAHGNGTCQAGVVDACNAIGDPAQLAFALVQTHTSNFRIKFEFESAGGNNVYIDDININGSPVSVGEQLGAGANVFQLADFQNWQIETEDLTELQIVNVEEGSQATISFDALPDLEITGTVDRIRLVGEDNRGDIVYTVIVTPSSMDKRLLWNMTAVVTFE